MIFNKRRAGTILLEKGVSPNAPFFPWVGGKRRLLPEIHSRLPRRYNKYIEPFVGGGAVFFSVAPHKAIINDYNPLITNAYKQVRDNPDEVIEELGYISHSMDTFQNIKMVDRDKARYGRLTPAFHAARFIYLLKASFASKWRVNKENEFTNTINPRIEEGEVFVDDKYEKVIYNCSRLLQNAQILTGDFMGVKPYIKEGDFVYLDPPYVPVSETANFVSYTEVGFDANMQKQVRNLCRYIDSVGAYFMVSNSTAPFVHELYEEFNVDVVSFNRSLAENRKTNAKTSEVLATNY
jgi:DNA adenine methylase